MSFCAFAQLVTRFILWDLRLLMNAASFLTLNDEKWGWRLRLSLRQRHKYILSKIQFGLQMTSPEERRKCCVKKEKQRQTFVLQIRTLACCSSIRYNSSDFGSCNLKGPSMDPKYGTPQFSSQLEIIHVLNETTPEIQHRKWGPYFYHFNSRNYNCNWKWKMNKNRILLKSKLFILFPVQSGQRAKKVIV